MRSGSSPLARGLRKRWWFIALVIGIIPARAGFTGRMLADELARRDHPRSRGVYRSASPATTPATGSSPLARGLRDDGRAHYGHTQDHPRSRGVYDRGFITGVGGSRIIPARAGFTGRRTAGRLRARDHPRSRGVYARHRPRGLREDGSSPLARGLRASLKPDVGHVGIIPARAGFTGERAAEVAELGDHPRSRGVYAAGGRSMNGDDGSSPLARGLLGYFVYEPGKTGIIPARAGFTQRLHHRSRRQQDHPRSRGVYVGTRSTGTSAGGSSPLARGLRGGDGRQGQARRIIPARAGFTSTRSPGTR